MQGIVDVLEKYPKQFKTASGLGAEKTAAIKKKQGIPEADTLLGVVDTSLTGNAGAGLFFTDKALYWSTNEATVDEKRKDKGSVRYRDLLHASIDVNHSFLDSLITIQKIEGSRDWQIIFIKFVAGEEYTQPLVDVINAAIAHAETLPEEAGEVLSAEGEYEAQARELFIGTDDVKTQAFYRNAFEAYLGGDSVGFALMWSWAAAILSPLYLVHRKLYDKALIVTGLSLLLGFVVPWIGLNVWFFPLAAIVIWIGVGTAGPYWVFQRYLAVRGQAEASIEDTEKRLDHIHAQGGFNPVTGKLGGPIGTILGVAILVLGGWWFLWGFLGVL